MLEQRTPGHALGGSVADLHRQGLTNAQGQPTRAIFVEKMSGWRLAWSADPLAAVNANRSFRALRACRLREERAAGLARLEAEERYELTAKGLAALVAAGMAEDRVALTAGWSRPLA